MFTEIVLILVSLLAYWYWKVTSKFDYWDKMAVFSPRASFPFGNNIMFNWNQISKKKNIITSAIEQFEEYGRPKFWGSFALGKPCLTLNDPEMIKQIFVKDFNHFVDRQNSETIKFFAGKTLTDTIWRKQLTTLTGDNWKDVRSTFSPIFTSGKLRGMLPLIHVIGDRLAKAFEHDAKTGEAFDLKDKFGKYSMDTIATCAFGVESNAFGKEGSKFVEMAKSIFRQDFKDNWPLMICLFPGGMRLLQMLGVSIMKPKQTMFFYSVLKNVIEQRRSSNASRNDLIDLMLEALKEEKHNVNHNTSAEDQFEADANLDHVADKKQFDDLTLIATSLVMFVGGYDTTATTLSYASYCLAMDEGVQQKLQEEIDTAIEENDGNYPDYNSIQTLPYLDQVIHETLRLHPAIGVVTRACTQEYTFPGTKLTIEKDMEVHINIAAIHKDPKHYPNPWKFDPEHFSKENKEKRHPYAFLGFGHGPRACIGMRFALLEAKLALIILLANFNIKKTDKTPPKITLDPASQLASPLGSLFVKVESRTDKVVKTNMD